MRRLIKFLHELSHRKVTRAAAGYIVIVWALSLGAVELFPVFGLGEGAVRSFMLIGVLGLPFAVLLSWRYDLTLQGVVRDSMDFPDGPPTPSKIKAWCLRRQDEVTPSLLKASWQDIDGSQQEQRFTEEILIGRESGNNIAINDPRVSRLHALVWFEPTGWYVRDLDSSNGSFLDERPVKGAVHMPPTCELRMHSKGPHIKFEVVGDVQTLLTLDGKVLNDNAPPLPSGSRPSP